MVTTIGNQQKHILIQHIWPGMFVLVGLGLQVWFGRFVLVGLVCQVCFGRVGLAGLFWKFGLVVWDLKGLASHC